MIQRITGGHTPIKAVLDDQCFFNKESIINVILRNNDYCYEYVLAVLNSSLISWFYKKKFTNESKLTVNLSKEYLGEIPINKCDLKTQELIKLMVLLISWSHKHLQYYEKIAENPIFLILDACIFETYFPDHMKKKKIDILRFVKKDIRAVTQIHNFEHLLEDEKEKTIKTLYEKWTYPDSEVRNRIKLFAVRSPDILKPILESR